MRFNSPGRVIDEVRYLKEVHGVNVFCIEDDLFLVHRKRALDIFEQLSKENVTLEFPNGMSVFHMNDDVMIEAHRETLTNTRGSQCYALGGLRTVIV